MKPDKDRGMWLTALVLCILFLSQSSVYASQPISQNASVRGHILYLPIPGNVSREEVFHADEKLKARLYRVASVSMASHGTPGSGGVDLVVVFVDHEGAPILPDLEDARHPASSCEKPALRELTFLFHSPDYPWTSRELSVLRRAARDFYRTIKGVYGQPAFSIKVNVRKDPTIAVQGAYLATTNEILLKSSASLDVFCHEIIHAFRDDDMITLSNYEEGMTVAAEVEVFNRLPEYTYWDEYHSYPYDVFYEALNNYVIGSFRCIFDYASPLLLLRYQLAGYAWGKVLLENPNFFLSFNQELYQRVMYEPDLLETEQALSEMASALQPSVEGKPFEVWYGQQGIFTSDPPAGSFLYQNSSNFVVYLFNRDSTGSEQMEPGATINWEVYDYRDRLLDEGSAITSDLGWISFAPNVPADYKGRIKMVTFCSTPQGRIENISLRTFGEEEGIFGVLTKDDSGTVDIIPLDEPGEEVGVAVVNGAFSAPSLASLRGRFIAVFTGEGGRSFSRQFNKDASNYFLFMDEKETTTDSNLFFDENIAIPFDSKENGY